jgi:hypothetical protein
MSPRAPAQDLKPGKCALMFIGNAERRLLKPECISPQIERHDLCSKLRPYLKRHHMQAGVGHYGVFSGKRWETQIYPILKNVILSSN